MISVGVCRFTCICLFMIVGAVVVLAVLMIAALLDGVAFEKLGDNLAYIFVCFIVIVHY